MASVVGRAVGISRRFTPPTYTLAEAWLSKWASPGDRVLADLKSLDLRRSRLRVRRIGDLTQALGGGQLQLWAHEWVVVSEKDFGHPGLARLVLAKEFVADYGFAGNRGVDLRIYVSPAALLPEATSIAPGSPEAAAFLGFEWGPRQDSQPGLELPTNGASLYLPAFTREDARLELEVVTSERTDAAAPSPLDLIVEGVAIPLEVVRVVEGRVLVRSQPIPPRLPPEARGARILSLQLLASSPVRVVGLAIR